MVVLLGTLVLRALWFLPRLTVPHSNCALHGFRNQQGAEGLPKLGNKTVC